MAKPIGGEGSAEQGGSPSQSSTGPTAVTEVLMQKVKYYTFRALVFGSFVLMLAAPTRWHSLIGS